MDKLPDDALFRIIRFLDKSDLISLRDVCTRLRSISYEPCLNRKLDFRSGFPSSADFVEKFLQDEKRLEFVQDLSISSLFWIESKTLKTHLLKMTDLKVLDVHGTLLTQRDLKAVVNACPNLTHLSWTCRLLSDQQTEARDISNSFKKIQVLCIYTQNLHEFIEIFPELLSGCNKLHSLYINYAVKAYAVMHNQEAMGRISRTNLKLSVLKVVASSLDLSSSRLGAIFVDKIIASCLTSENFENSTSPADRRVFRCVWNEVCSSFHLEDDFTWEQKREACYEEIYGAETRAAAFCFTPIPPVDFDSKNQDFVGKILSLCLNDKSQLEHLSQLLSQHTRLQQLRVTTGLQSASEHAVSSVKDLEGR
ncbi:uncharacterized protein LOC136024836 isoform X2 [Artemia franciscana]|uniref:uncharacterized protein LOC136024836 isoform X2 n=1 Tax=Artemia franciscana TaxID=6661 RepID=UPI0032DAE557